jgi:hypothetical protein
MPSAVRIPISILPAGDAYTAPLSIGSGGVAVQMLLDTGSAALAVDGGFYNPASDTNASTTKLLQVVSYGSASFVGAVVRTSISFGGSAGVSLPGANLAVTYDGRRLTFGAAQGIIGLAYRALDSAYLMPADTWQTEYDADQVSLGQAADLDPFPDQLAAQGLAALKFAFSIRRSNPTVGADASANQGLFVLGGGAECADLYDGPLASIAVMHEQLFNVALLSVQVGNQPAIAVPPIAPGRQAASNAIIDSGTGVLRLDQGLYTQVLAAFSAIAPDFANQLQLYAADRGGGCDQSQLDLALWPTLQFTFQGTDGTATPIPILPTDYWQFDSSIAGRATAMISGDRGAGGGQSLLGLPLFTSRFVVFDRTASNGHGAILISQPSPPVAATS